MTTETAQAAAIPADTFELRLSIIRFHAGLNVKEAAARVSVSGQTWANWEAGKSAAARQPRTLSYIARQFGVDEDWLRDGGPLGVAGSGPNDGQEAPAVGLEPTAVRLTVLPTGRLARFARRDRRARPRPRHLVLPVEVAA